MKKITLLLAILFAGLNCFAQNGEPCAPYKEDGYSVAEAAVKISHDSVFLLPEYALVFQKIGEHDGWPNTKITIKRAMYLLNRLTDGTDSWANAEIPIGSKVIDQGKKTMRYFSRPSYSSRVNKTLGQEQVGILDITAITGWKDKNGNPFPKRIVMARRCLNPMIDLREVPVKLNPKDYQPIKPENPKASTNQTKPEIIVKRDTVWAEKKCPECPSSSEENILYTDPRYVHPVKKDGRKGFYPWQNESVGVHYCNANCGHLIYPVPHVHGNGCGHFWLGVGLGWGVSVSVSSNTYVPVYNNGYADGSSNYYRH